MGPDDAAGNPPTESRRATYIGALLATACVVAVYIAAFFYSERPFNPDEYAHFDYVAAIAVEGRVPVIRDQALSLTADAFSCSQLREGLALACGATGQDPRLLPWAGQNAATANPSPYYLLTALGTRGLMTGLHSSPLPAARLISALWSVLLVMAVALLAMSLASGWRVAASIVLSGLSPLMITYSSAVQPETAATALGVLSIAAWLWLRLRPSWVRISTALALSVLATTMRPQAIVAAAAVIALETRRYSPTKRTRVALGAGIGYLSITMLVFAVDAMARGGVSDNGLLEAYVREHWSQRLVDTVLMGWVSAPASLGWPFPANDVRPGGTVLALASVLTVLLCAAIVLIHRRGETGVIGITGIAAFIALPAALVLVLSIQGQALFFQSRYLMLAAVLVVCAGVAASRGRPAIVLGGLSVLSLVAALAGSVPLILTG